MANSLILKEFEKHVGKAPIKVVEIGKEPGKYHFVYGGVLEVDEHNVILKTQWGIKQIPLDDVREIQDLSHRNGGA